LREPGGALQIPPLRSCGAPVGMTRGEGWLRLKLLAGWTDPQFLPARDYFDFSHLSPLVIPTEAKRSGGICSAPFRLSNSSQETPRVQNAIRIKLPFYLPHQRQTIRQRPPAIQLGLRRLLEDHQ
jgi:hypothetical protein